MGRDARATARRRALLANGIHPATRRPFPPDSDATCGDCAHLYVKVQSRRWFKCDATPYCYDMRRRWPACHLYRPAGQVSDPAATIAP